MEKKRAGRPKKDAFCGVECTPVTNVAETDTMIEAVLKDINVFKQTIHLFKNVGWLYIYVQFNADGMLLYSQNQLQENMILLRILPNVFVSYKCKIADYRLKFQITDLTEVTSQINNNYRYMSFILTSTNEFNIVLHNVDIEFESIYRINKMIYIENIWQTIDTCIANLSEYPLSFCIPVKDIKKTLNCDMPIDKLMLTYANETICIHHVDGNNKCTRSTRYKNLSKLDVSLASQDQSLTVAFKLTNMFSSIFAHDKLLFYVHPVNDLIIQLCNISLGTIYISVKLCK